MERRGEVREIVEAWTGPRTRREVSEALAGKVPHGPVNTAPDLASDPHVRARQMYVAIDHAEPDGELNAVVRDKRIPLIVTKLPFVQHRYAR